MTKLQFDGFKRVGCVNSISVSKALTILPLQITIILMCLVEYIIISIVRTHLQGQ